MTWPMVKLAEVLQPVTDPHVVRTDREYPNFGIYSYGRGLFLKPPISGATTSAKTLFRVRRGQFIYSRLFAFEGAYGLVGEEFDGHFVSNEYPTFESDSHRLDLQFLARYFQRPRTWEDFAASASGMGHRRQRVQPEQFLSRSIPLPPLSVQHRLVARINALAAKIDEAKQVSEVSLQRDQSLLEAAFREIAANVPRRKLGEIAPLNRRPATVNLTAEYPQISVRSFGRGTFYNPPLKGSEITWEKPHRVEAGDILVSNIKAWEGAIAVVKPEDGGRYGSHRYLTYVPVPGVATARYVCFYLLTPEGLFHVGEASPGSADRNRTTSAKGLLEIPVPVPSYERQVWFGQLFAKVEAVRQVREETAFARDAMLPAILDRAFRGSCDPVRWLACCS